MHRLEIFYNLSNVRIKVLTIVLGDWSWAVQIETHITKQAMIRILMILILILLMFIR
jgi:hypothetical protein